jgi:tetratricopeptide (TPR) repeat protein
MAAKPASAVSARPTNPMRVPNAHSTVLVGKGGTLLHLGQTEQALQCFEEALATDVNNAEAWVNKGLALEQMQRLEEALESYDRALALDKSITAAYLYKGGVCNQLQRHSEALECYDRALQTAQAGHQG